MALHNIIAELLKLNLMSCCLLGSDSITCKTPACACASVVWFGRLHCGQKNCLFAQICMPNSEKKKKKD